MLFWIFFFSFIEASGYILPHIIFILFDLRLKWCNNSLYGEIFFLLLSCMNSPESGFSSKLSSQCLFLFIAYLLDFDILQFNFLRIQTYLVMDICLFSLLFFFNDKGNEKHTFDSRCFLSSYVYIPFFFVIFLITREMRTHLWFEMFLYSS